MPTPSEQIPFSQDLLNLDSFQEDPQQRRVPDRKSPGKIRKKHGRANEDTEEDGAQKTKAQHIAPHPSILSQLRSSSFASQTDLTSNLDPSLETSNDPSTERRSGSCKHTTAEWTRTVPYGKSPPETNGASVAGSQHETHTYKGGFSQNSPPTSPRVAHRGLAQRSNEYQSFGGFHEASPPRAGAPSMFSRNSHYAPPPHLTQAHFYGAPDLDLRQAKNDQSQQAQRDSPRCVFDRVPLANHEGSVSYQDVLLVARDRGLDIYHVNKKNLVRVGCLRNLRGAVLSPKIIPSLPLDSTPFNSNILVALVIHGPCTSLDASMGQEQNDEAHDGFDASASMIQALQTAGTDCYQTTVEVYSLKNAQHSMTLFASPKIPSKPHRWGGKPIAPSPIGGLSVEARGSFVIISSCVSGEIFIYKCSHSGKQSIPVDFRCIGKSWTALASKKARSSSMSSRDSGQMQEEDDESGATDQPVASLSTRWLVVAPPSSSNQTTIHGQVPGSQVRKIPGLASHVAPEQPQVTCQLDTPGPESFINRMTRDATQEFVKGARWVGSQGIQAWNNYWTKPTDTGQHGYSGTAQPDTHPVAAAPPQYFPPTHAQENLSTRAKNGPAMVSILDLEKLSQTQQLKETVSLQPVATFSLPNGCSAVSFAPSGVHLFTASAKGDTQQIWDLMRLIHGEVERREQLITSLKGPVIRQVACFTRITEARITDVAWTRPTGERLAMATDNGTVHIYGLPTSAFYWPPLRQSRRVVSAPTHEAKPDSRGSQQDSWEDSGSTLSSAFGIFAGKTQPLLSAVRGRTASAGSPFPGFGGFTSTAGAGAKGGRAVAAGINRSFTAAASGTVNTIRHLGENRLNLPGAPRSTLNGCTTWLGGKDETLLAVTASGVVRIHSIRLSTSSARRNGRTSARGTKPTEIVVPQQDDEYVHSPNSVPLATTGTLGSFWLPPDLRSSSPGLQQDTHPLSYAEIETHAPYQPFHTDHRVAFNIYDEDTVQRDARGLQDEDAWVFGEDILSTKVNVTTTFNDDDNLDMNDRIEMENVVRREGNGEEGQHILVTTRRKRHRTGDLAMGDESEFFEDELEVVDFAHERV